MGKLDVHMHKNKPELFLLPPAKVRSQRVKGLTVKPETIKLLEENIGDVLYAIGLSKNFLGQEHKIKD